MNGITTQSLKEGGVSGFTTELDEGRGTASAAKYHLNAQRKTVTIRMKIENHENYA
jgi:hypothetical protein